MSAFYFTQAMNRIQAMFTMQVCAVRGLQTIISAVIQQAKVCRCDWLKLCHVTQLTVC